MVSVYLFRLEVELDSQPEADVKWFVNEVQVSPTQRTQLYKDGNNHVLVIVDVTPEDAGEYVCKAENIHGTTTCKTTLIVTRKCHIPPFVFQFSVHVCAY